MTYEAPGIGDRKHVYRYANFWASVFLFLRNLHEK